MAHLRSSLVTLLLLTAHARNDRFCEGHLVAMIESGHVAACLRRLRDLRPAS